MRIFEPFMEVLPPAQKQLWPKLSPLKDLGFVLYGGTAIALQLGHRESIDFDFFASTPLDKTTLQKACPWLEQSLTIQDEPNTWTVLGGRADKTVKVSFFGAITLGRIGEPQYTQDQVLATASLNDLFALKLSLILRRAEAKDYLDITALLQAGFNLSEGLAGARALYGPNFQPSESLKALTYFEDGDLSQLPQEAREALIVAASTEGRLPRVQKVSSLLL